MLRDLLSSRWFQGGLAFFLLCVGGSLLYSWHVKRTTERGMARHNRFLQGHEKQNETRPAEKVIVENANESPGFVNTPDENSDTQMYEETEAFPNVDDEFADAFLPEDFVSEEEIAEDVPVSPHGFGPYPEIPANFPNEWIAGLPWLWSEERLARTETYQQGALQQRGISFTEYMKIQELLGRLNIQLWNEGRDFNGITTADDTGLFYPDEPNVLYVDWGEVELPNGKVRRYIARSIGSELHNMPIPARQGREPPPDWMEIRSFNEGIDPYRYLGLNR